MISRLCVEKIEYLKKTANELFNKLDGLRERTNDLNELLEQPEKLANACFSKLENSISERKKSLIQAIEVDYKNLIDKLDSQKVAFKSKVQLKMSENSESKIEAEDLVHRVEIFYDRYFNELDSFDLNNEDDECLKTMTDAISRSDYLMDEIELNESRISSVVYNEMTLRFKENSHKENLIGEIEPIKIKDSTTIIKKENSGELEKHSFKYIRTIDYKHLLNNDTTAYPANLIQLNHDKYLFYYRPQSNKPIQMYIVDSNFNIVIEKKGFAVKKFRATFCNNTLLFYFIIESECLTFNDQSEETANNQCILLVDTNTLEDKEKFRGLQDWYEDMTCNDENVFIKTSNQNTLLIMNMKLEITKRILTDQMGVFYLPEGFQRIFFTKNLLIFVFKEQTKNQFAKIINLITKKSKIIDFFSKDNQAEMIINLFLLDSNHLAAINLFEKMQVYNLTSGEIFVDTRLGLPKEEYYGNTTSLAYSCRDCVYFYLINKNNTLIHQIKYDY
jgi:hypothetical protein